MDQHEEIPSFPLDPSFRLSRFSVCNVFTTREKKKKKKCVRFKSKIVPRIGEQTGNEIVILAEKGRRERI